MLKSGGYTDIPLHSDAAQKFQGPPSLSLDFSHVMLQVQILPYMGTSKFQHPLPPCLSLDGKHKITRFLLFPLKLFRYNYAP